MVVAVDFGGFSGAASATRCRHCWRRSGSGPVLACEICRLGFEATICFALSGSQIIAQTGQIGGPAALMGQKLRSNFTTAAGRLGTSRPAGGARGQSLARLRPKWSASRERLLKIQRCRLWPTDAFGLWAFATISLVIQFKLQRSNSSQPARATN